MTRARRTTLAAELCALVIVLAACGGGGNKTATATLGAGASKDSTPASPPRATPSESATGGGDPELKAVAARFAASTFKAKYTATGGGSADDTTQITEIRLTKDGDKKFRFDVKGTQDGKEVSIISIETGDISAFCLKNAGDLGALLGISADQGVCFKNDVAAGVNPIGGLADSLRDFESSNVTLLEKSAKTIAGQEGSCYKTRDNTSGDVSLACFSKDGALLSSDTGGTDASTIVATEITGGVTADDFTLPYEVKDLPGG